MNSSTLILAPFAGIALLLSSCAVSTPQSRIAQNPGAFESLNSRQQGLVERGKIEKGMPQKGVLLALGHPASRTEGYRDNAEYERWLYTKFQPTYSNRFFGSYNLGSYGHHGHRYGGLGVGFAPSIEYYPSRSATVWFQDDKVESWERTSPQP